MTQAIVVRSTLADRDQREEFESWARNFIPEVIHKIKPDITRRGWSLINPSIHVTAFMFDDPTKAAEAMDHITAQSLPEAQRQFPNATRAVDHIDYAQEWLAG